ncbi:MULTISPECIES: ATP-binding protein [Streptomycetaceae]|uniref:Signal transduction histidine-protein kinase/phosphatase MprB n=1 Tax=Streptantibioticus cattleyicolor (strain ATCC 35852 / DSM 46488 / JCM 4925 / NBRC 14057 / NRRL 8057) TaxID=1003195 RepID=F8JVE3_STREN|nr:MULTISPECIES: ATP-binding protein [Streptomycetaceae]AEW94425.1 putative two-component system sensor kinase [Streptantibioticus cattleyicolor NRRL 8057 = DSM 46488]MYS59073.1 two-component sensor histidine kinase [Streptomyces sp. SID5468]CCB74783.1 Sensor protein [Streptantibioticus cattleyicolor NRRL 8057 = DSM 46488]
MRRRLINSTLAVVLVVIAVFGLSLVIVESRTIESSAKDAVQSDAIQLIGVVENRIAAGEKVSPPALTRQIDSRRYAVVRVPGQPPITLGTPPSGQVVQARRDGVHGESVVVQEPRSVISQEIGRTLLVILAVALLAIAAAVVLAIGQARRLVAPLTDLAETAERLGSGDPRPRHKRYGVPELDRVADVLDASAERIARMLTAERRLAADASHQLRTPLTALSMRLEEIIATDDHDTVKEEATIALGQVERLTDVVQRLLTNSRDPRTGSAVAFDLDEVIKQQLEEWRPAYRGEGRGISRSGTPGLRAVGTPGAVAQVLATLIENALMHGAGAVGIHTRVTGNQVVVEVTDEGQGVPADLGSRVFERTVSGRNSTGLGLAVARDLAEADGGRLELLQGRPPVFALFLAREGAPGAATRPAEDDQGPSPIR